MEIRFLVNMLDWSGLKIVLAWIAQILHRKVLTWIIKGVFERGTNPWKTN